MWRSRRQRSPEESLFFIIKGYRLHPHLQLRELVGPLWRHAGKTFQTEAFLPILTKHSETSINTVASGDLPSVKADGLFL